MTWGEEKVPLSRRPPRGHSSVLQRMGREATAQNPEIFMAILYHIHEVCQYLTHIHKSPRDEAILGGSLQYPRPGVKPAPRRYMISFTFYLLRVTS